MATNRYAGDCGKCGRTVPAQAGLLRKGASGWLVFHEACPTGNVPSIADVLAYDEQAVTVKAKVFPPTAEQAECIRIFNSGANLVIQAGAGTGKTTTLRYLAVEAAQVGRRGVYTAYNKAIVEDTKRTMPPSVECRTMHSMARAAVGWKYSHRIGGSRQSAGEAARLLGIREFTIPAGASVKRLAAGWLASRTLGAVKKFCGSVDDEVGVRHFEFVDGLDPVDEHGDRGRANNDRVAEHLLPYARKAWADLCDPRGQLRFLHDHYLKMWALGDPVIDGDYVLFDECQLPSASILMAGGRTKRLRDVAVGDRVASYTKGRILSTSLGSKVLGKSVRPFEGNLVNVSTGGRSSAYTPNHICMARVGAAFEGRYSLYLMREDTRWRVGVTQARHGRGAHRGTGIMGRLSEERGDAMWVLDSFGTRAEAEAAEQATSLTWRIPQVRFRSSLPSRQAGLYKFWAQWDVTFSDAEGCARHYGRDLGYPLIEGSQRLLGDRFTEIRAANLMDGMEMMEAEGMTLRPITVWRTPYSGPVVSLAVSGPATYVADGIVTHNCQDADPVQAQIIEKQRARGMQVVAVGDECQTIYDWRGAVNAMADFEESGAEVTFLSQSFRFGPAIADVANGLLGRLDARLRLEGFDRIESTVGPVDQPKTVLCRTNAGAVKVVLNALDAGRRPHLVGSAKEIISFCVAAEDLQAGRTPKHPELSIFSSWPAVQEYVDGDDGGDLKLMVKLVDEFGARTIIAALEQQPPEHLADLVVSTAHKAKGREWDTVRINSDFFPPRDGDLSPSELRLGYVAATRAKLALDLSSVPHLSLAFRPKNVGRSGL